MGQEAHPVEGALFLTPQKGPAAGPWQKHPQQVVPYCVSTVPDATLSEADPRGLEGRCGRARHHRNSAAQLIELAGKGRGAQPLAPREP